MFERLTTVNLGNIILNRSLVRYEISEHQPLMESGANLQSVFIFVKTNPFGNSLVWRTIKRKPSFLSGPHAN